MRLYVAAAQMRRVESWWHRVNPQTLGSFLLQQAKRAGIQQALLPRVIGGYLNPQTRS